MGGCAKLAWSCAAGRRWIGGAERSARHCLTESRYAGHYRTDSWGPNAWIADAEYAGNDPEHNQPERHCAGEDPQYNKSERDSARNDAEQNAECESKRRASRQQSKHESECTRSYSTEYAAPNQYDASAGAEQHHAPASTAAGARFLNLRSLF